MLRIRDVLDADSMGPLDPDPDTQSGSGSRRAKMTHKNRKKLKNFIFKCWMFSFEGCILLPVAWTSFKEAKG